MEHSELDDLLRNYGEQRLAETPPAFEQDVWRKIRQQTSEAPASDAGFFTWLLRPQRILSALVLAVMVGAGLGAQASQPVAPKAQAALNLDVFGQKSPSLPSTLLSDRL